MASLLRKRDRVLRLVLIALLGSVFCGIGVVGDFPQLDGTFSGQYSFDVEPCVHFNFQLNAATGSYSAGGNGGFIFVSKYGQSDELFYGSGCRFTNVTPSVCPDATSLSDPSTAAAFSLQGLYLAVATDGDAPNRIYHGFQLQPPQIFSDGGSFSALDVEFFVSHKNSLGNDLIFAVPGQVNQLYTQVTLQYTSEGFPRFTNVTSQKVSGAVKDDTEDVVAVDVDGDGDQDLVFANANTPHGQQNRIWINQGSNTGRFVDETTRRLPVKLNCSVDVEAADVDGDGDMDLHFSNAKPGGQRNTLLLNDGHGRFFNDVSDSHLPTVHTESTSDAEFWDVDEDGDVDLFLANGLFTLNQGTTSEPNKLYLNDGSGRFLSQGDYLGSGIHFTYLSRDAEFVDTNGDDGLDLLVANYNGPDWVLLDDDHPLVGEPLLEWGGKGSGPGGFVAPVDIAVGSYVYVADRGNSRIQKFTADGAFARAWGESGSGDGQFKRLSGICVDQAGYVYVADYGNSRIQKFTANGTFVARWGSAGHGDGEFGFGGPAGIAIGQDGHVYVTDPGNNRVQLFSSSGSFIAKWETYGPGDEPFKNPEAIAVDSLGHVYVSEYSGRHRVSRVVKLDSYGKLVAMWGRLGSGDGEFKTISGIAVDDWSRVYVTDSDNHRIQKFSPSGAYLTQWGSQGSGEGQMELPRGIAVDGAGSIYVCDSGNHRIQKYRGGVAQSC